MAHNFLSRLTGSFAMPAAENPTVAMVEAAYRHHRLDIRYINCEVPPEKLGDAVKGARAMGWIGFNCSIPHKVAVIDHLDGLGESASVMGAVNCAVRRGDKFIGENTDGKGFLQSLRTVADPAGATVVMFGAGGAARAIGVELALAGARRIIVVNRDEKRGRGLVDLLNGKTMVKAELVPWRGTFSIPNEASIAINATSIGLYPDVDGRLDIDPASLRPGLVVADVIPNPPSTHLLCTASERGCTVLDGLGMLVNQGVIGIKYWTGVDVNPKVMRAELERLFQVFRLAKGPQQKDVECTFCGKAYPPEVSKGQVVAGPTAFICRECVGLTIEIFSAEDPKWATEKLKLLESQLTQK